MYLANLGGRSRKLGLVPKDNIKIDRYGLEDVDDFFGDDSIASPGKPELERKQSRSQSRSQFKKQVEPVKEQPFDNIARKINFNDEDADETFNLSSTISNKKSPAINKQSPLRSPLAEQDFDYNQFDDDIPEDDMNLEQDRSHGNDESVGVVDFSMDDNDDNSLEEERPIEVFRKTRSTKGESKPRLIKGSSSFTKKMALGKTKILPSSFTDDTTSSITEYNESPTELEDDEKDESFQEYSSEMSGVRRSQVINESNLPSPPPDNTTGLRRSKRTRIKPLAFWRNERIIYTQDFNSDEDFDTTLARDIHNIPLQLIKEVVHIPDNNSENIRSTTKKSSTRSRRKLVKRPQTPTSDNDTNDDDEQEIGDKEEQENLSGTEWMQDEDCLELTVKDNGGLKKRKIAYNQNGGNFKQQSDDNYKVATLFDEDRDFCAGGMLELPVDGFKPPVTVTGSTYMFNVMKGTIRVTLNEDVFIVKKGCKLQIPEGNEYSLRNVGKSEAYLFFVQISKPEEVEDTW